MSRRVRRRSEDANISFLDIICCGFGAIILLLVIVKPSQPTVLEESIIQDKGLVRALQERLFEIRGQVAYLETELNAKQQQLGKDQRRVAILRSEFDVLNSRQASVDDNGADDASQLEDLQIALQSLSREMQRLLKGRKKLNEYVAGVPVDSEYIIFIIDSSGSMKTSAWPKLVREVQSTLTIYPKVKGIQVMNNEGIYMFPQYRDRFMPDTPARRRDIIRKLNDWSAFSASTPVGGITRAIKQHFDKNKKISLYVMGDDYQGRSVARVVKAVAELNEANAQGETLVRIHGVGFPVLVNSATGPNSSATRYANLMRQLAEQNNGTFIGLNSNVR
ncbi:vWA domain-containing protein [Arenicella xantha]|uniref:von Willebrand factor type A domain-containing protein n=1 Tax=Arenicella xantha TaxID=644221 RepID=A0A395JNL3_9GAMM|nr:vWA domain-containing protein [Arenicella xantha]RBP53231.1 hypothetical protein DFR28_101617 [Arenicella xantha]